MIVLRRVEQKDRELLWNINQKYLYEMTAFYPDELDEHGNYAYRYFDAYFTEPERTVYFICCDDQDETMIGFAMLNPYSYVGHQPDHVIAEFTVFPAYRRKHYALAAAKAILAKHPGKWEIKFAERNTGAKRLWETVAAPYRPVVHHINEEETVLEFAN